MAGSPTIAAVLAAATLAQAATPASDPPLSAEVERVAAAVSAARHLPFHGPLPTRAIGPSGIRSEVAAAVAAGAPSSGPTAEEPFLRRLGVIPPSGDYARRLAETYAEAPVPIYDPGTKRLLVPERLPSAELAPLLPHEIAHAVADQRFGLRRLLEIGADGSHHLGGDAERARLALIEGDATLTALELADPRETFLGARELRALATNLREAAIPPSAPAWTTTLGIFTHVDGLMFVARVRARQPWRGVDALWEDPPSSTEQVLHPEKYDACEEPTPVDPNVLPTLPGIGRPIATATLGELVIRTWLSSTLSPELAERAAAGWAGDRAGLYAAAPQPAASNPDPPSEPPEEAPAAKEPAGEPPLAWLTVWDDAGEAEDFARAAAAAGVVDLARRDEAVALLFGVADDPLAALSDMLTDWRRQRGRVKGVAGVGLTNGRTPTLRAGPASRPGARPRPAARPDCPRRDRAAAPR